MTSAFDPRIVQLSLEFEEGTQVFEGLTIYAQGQKFESATTSFCEIKVFNLTKDQRNYILSRTSPLNPNRIPVKMTLDVGRESYGTFRLYEGGISKSSVTQPPDIGIILTAFTNNVQIGVILNNQKNEIAQLSSIAQTIADNNGVVLDFQAADKQIRNYMYSGSAAFQVKDLNEVGGILAFIDNGTLTVLDAGTPAKAPPRLVSADTGMIGVPQFSDNGITVKVMIDNTIQIAHLITINSIEVPAANGDWIVQKIFFEVASRDQAFWYTLECTVPKYYAGTIG